MSLCLEKHNGTVYLIYRETNFPDPQINTKPKQETFDTFTRYLKLRQIKEEIRASAFTELM